MLMNVIIPVALILFGLIAIGMPIYVGILAATIYLQLFVNHMPLQSMFSGMFEALNKNSLMAIPYFVVAGTFISGSSLGKRLMDVFLVLCKRIRGGLAISCVLANAVFGAISGSPAAAAAIFGKIIYKPLEENYDEKLALGVITSSSGLASIIPPSTLFIVYGICTDTSVGHLFKSGILPGLLLVAMLSAYLFFRYRKIETDVHVKGERRRAIRSSIPVMLLPVIVLGGIYGGIVTPTEAGALSMLYSFVVSVFILKDVKFRQIPGLLKSSGKTVAQIFILIASSTVFAQALTVSQAPQYLATTFGSLSQFQFLLLLNVLLLIIGCLFDTGAAVLIFAPLLLPAAKMLGINPIHMGLVFTINLSIGFFTPPFGMSLFVAQSVLNKPIGTIARGVVPFVIIYVIGLLVITYVPWFGQALL